MKLLFLIWTIVRGDLGELAKYGKRISLTESTSNYEKFLKLNEMDSITESHNSYRRSMEELNASYWQSAAAGREDNLNNFSSINDQRRLIEDLLNSSFYEKTVHPKRDHNRPTRVNLSMSLYQILEVDEHLQSLTVNVWMVQNWFDEFLDWNPYDYGMINKTIVPSDEIWIPDTYLYNSETIEQKKTESIMNAIVETGYWAGDGRGARVQLMFPAIYKLTCAMNVQWFPYDSQNCTFIISSWTRDKSTIDYWPSRPSVNLVNMARNDEWQVMGFEFNRIEQKYKCCKEPWVMMYAHLVIKRKPMYYIINLVIPTSIITIVAVTGFFTPTSSSSERDEKLYLGINTLLTMSIMMLMVCNQMPSTSTYVPLMSWYYIGIIGVIVVGTLLATVVLAIHGEKHMNEPLPKWLRRIVHNRFVNGLILDVPTALLDLWTEFGISNEPRPSTMDPVLQAALDPVSQLPPPPRVFFGSFSSQASDPNSLQHTRHLAVLTRQYTQQVKNKERERRNNILNRSGHSRAVKLQKMSRRCALEWEFVANVIDRILLSSFSLMTFFLFLLLVFFDSIHAIYHDLRTRF